MAPDGDAEGVEWVSTQYASMRPGHMAPDGLMQNPANYPVGRLQ